MYFLMDGIRPTASSTFRKRALKKYISSEIKLSRYVLESCGIDSYFYIPYCKGGNDYEIFSDSRTVGHSVKGPDETIPLVKKLFISGSN